MKSSVKKDLDTLSKNLYLESPDLWIEFLDKVNSGIFDELVLFFATKYNYAVSYTHLTLPTTPYV